MSNFSTKPFQLKIEKPWGHELIVTPEGSSVVGKIAFTKAGHRWSFQYHDVKDEYLVLAKGQGQMWLENDTGEIEKINMEINKSYHVKPKQKHRFCGISNCWTFEVSTPEAGYTVRLDDDYSRGTETEKDRERLRTKTQ